MTANYRRSPGATGAGISIGVWLIICFGLLASMMMRTVPSTESVFRDFDAELPAVTQRVIGFADWFNHYWYVVATAWIGLIAACVMLCKPGQVREAKWIRNVVVVVVLVALAISAFGVYLPFQSLMNKLN